MAQHVRYTDGEKNERAVIKFTREDLLWRGTIGNITVPIEDRRRLVGPTVLDCLVRHQDEEGQGAHWSLRDQRSFIEPDRQKRAGGFHPFRAGLVSGGKPVDADGDFIRVTKTSSVSIGAYAYRLAVGTLGSVRAAQAAISAKAAAAWAADLARSRALYEAIRNAPDGRLEETQEIAALRPAGSISDQIETELLREACVMLGVDPDLNISRPAGRPRKDAAGETEEGDFISVTILDGALSGKTIAAIGSVPAHTDLSSLTVLKLVSLLDVLRQGSAEADADLLEAFLDACEPEWREISSATSTEGSLANDDPYEILGVQRGASLQEITLAYRRAVQALHPDRGPWTRWFVQVALAAYRRIKDELKDSTP